MKYLAAFVLSASVFAQDAITPEEWAKTAAAIRAENILTIEKVAKIRKLAESKRVKRTDQVFDIRPSRQEGYVVVDLVRIETDDAKESVKVPAAAVRGWKRWDRVTRHHRIRVLDNSTTQLVWKYGPGSLEHSKDPGFVYLPGPAKAPYAQEEFERAFKNAIGLARSGDRTKHKGRTMTDEAWRLLSRTKNRGFFVDVRVVRRAGENIYLVPFVKIKHPKILESAQPGWVIRVARVVRTDAKNAAEMMATDHPYRYQVQVVSVTKPK